MTVLDYFTLLFFAWAGEVSFHEVFRTASLSCLVSNIVVHLEIGTQMEQNGPAEL